MSKYGTDIRKIYGTFIGCFAYLGLMYSVIGKVPANHVTLLTDSNGKPKDNIIFDDKQFFFYNPLKSHPKHLRVIPVKKRLVKEFITRDKKNVEVVVVLRSQPKIAYAIDIYRAFGNDYSRGFLEKEVSFDIQEVLKDYNYEQLVNTESVSDEIIRDLEVRVNEAAAFHHLTISDMTFVFRDPNADDF